MEERLSRVEACRMIGCGMRTLQRAVKSGRLQAIREHGRIWVTPGEARRFRETLGLHIDPLTLALNYTERLTLEFRADA
jgi:hypothetical protein